MKKPTVFILLLIILFSALPAGAQASIEVTNPRVSYIFGESVTFTLQVNDPARITDSIIFFRAEGEQNTRVERATLNPDGSIVYTHNIASAPLRPFATVTFWVRLTLNDNTVYESGQFFFSYNDNRFNWQSLSGDNLNIHWVEGDAAFGQQAQDTARTAQARLSQLLPVSLSRPLNIYIYPTPADLQSALERNGQAWVGGHTSPDLRVVLVSITPGPEQGLQMDRKIPHELGHAVLYEYTGAGYDSLPIWLREGLSSVIEAAPSPDYPLAIESAAASNALIPMAELCNSFPPDAGRAFLAYAQSASFTRYIVDTYGATGLQSLITAYSRGFDCQQGAQQSLGKSLIELENGWRARELGQDWLAGGLAGLLPYLVLFAFVLFFPFVIGLSSLFQKR